MKIVNIIGGLGNQMFQYAFAYSLKMKFPDEKVMIDKSHFGHIFFKKYKGANLHNGFEIDKVFPNADIPCAKPYELMRVTWYMPNYVLSRLMRRILPVRKTELIQPNSDYFAHNESYYAVTRNCYFEGIWASANNYIPIRKDIQNLFSHGTPNELNSQYISKMASEDCVGIHIRRGDYLQCPDFIGISDLDYYQRAIDVILSDGQKYVFYIFSNDIKWCKEHISPLLQGNEVIFVTHNIGNDSCWDMFLMSYCKDLIIANSSFSWWGAFLNTRQGRVVAPKKWVNRDAEFDVWLDEWIRL